MAPLSAPPLFRTQPAVLKFSLYYPGIDASNYGFIASDVLTPIQQLLCDNSFLLINSRVDGETMCPKMSSTTSFDWKAPYFGDPNNTVMMQVPIFVEDSPINKDNDDVQWMTWTVAFHVVQLGQPLMDMAMIGGEEAQPSDLKVSQVLNNVLRLALQVNIMEGEMDELLDVSLPGAHIAVEGEELSTWSHYGIFSDETMMAATTPLSKGHLPQHHLYQDGSSRPSLRPSSNGSSSSSSNSMSVVATAMYESHSLRQFGMGLFSGMMVLLVSLVQLGKRRRKQRQRLYQDHQQNRSKRRNLQLATEDDVCAMLKAGTRHLHNQNQDPSVESSSSSNDERLDAPSAMTFA
jgi:hypothetical protein